jgi:hypothetical protein
VKQYRLQRRQHPLFSPLAILPTLFLICGLSAGVYLSGGQAFSPGELSAVSRNGVELGGFLTHAEFGDRCSQCHAPFQGIEAERCETCHESVAQQRRTVSGIHSRFELVDECAHCHLEHAGSGFDLGAAALANFDHETTQFSLVRHGLDYQSTPFECTACHETRGEFTLLITACTDCHRQAQSEFMAVHIQAYGTDCLACHDGRDTLASFSVESHAQVFALTGAHVDTSCEGCHAGGRFKEVSTQCVACHSDPEAHSGLLGTECAACHTSNAWLPASLDGVPFDHGGDTAFSLVTHTDGYDGLPLTCHACHPGLPNSPSWSAGQGAGTTGRSLAWDSSECVDCHRTADLAFMDSHLTQFSEQCLSCHDGSGNMANFDHNLVWVLEGKHTLLECTACHANQVFRGTATECVACHPEPTLHVGLFGTDCAACHTAQAWQPARLTHHTFPLGHGDEGEIACETCHVTVYTQYTCYDCHAHDPAETEHKHLEEGISPAELPDCVQCHPTGREGEVERGDEA